MVTRSERTDYFKAALGYHLNFEVDPLIAFHKTIQDYIFVYEAQEPDWPQLLKGL